MTREARAFIGDREFVLVADLTRLGRLEAHFSQPWHALLQSVSGFTIRQNLEMFRILADVKDSPDTLITAFSDLPTYKRAVVAMQEAFAAAMPARAEGDADAEGGGEATEPPQ